MNYYLRSTVEAFHRFLKQQRVRKFEKGELILCQGEIPESVYVVKKGIIKTYNLTSQGEEKPISFEMKDEIFSVGWLFSKVRWAMYYHEAFTDCEIYSIPRQEFADFIRKNPTYALNLVDKLAALYVNYQMRVNALEQSKATFKVLYTIHFLCLRYGKDVKDNTVKIQLPLTQQDLANFMGLTRETAGIELKKLQRKGVLTYRRQSYLVKTDKLDALLDEDYDQGLNLAAFGK